MVLRSPSALEGAQPLKNPLRLYLAMQRAACQQQIVCLARIHFPLSKHSHSQWINDSELIQALAKKRHRKEQ